MNLNYLHSLLISRFSCAHSLPHTFAAYKKPPAVDPVQVKKHTPYRDLAVLQASLTGVILSLVLLEVQLINTIQISIHK